MRVFTTMSLTHSDGYVMYNTGTGTLPNPDPDAIYPWGPEHEHFWYPFWDANLGRPIGPKAQRYQNIEGLFIREFTNGWAVYNRSGSTQEQFRLRRMPQEWQAVRQAQSIDWRI